RAPGCGRSRENRTRRRPRCGVAARALRARRTCGTSLERGPRDRLGPWVACFRWSVAPLNGVAHCFRWFVAPLNGVVHCLRWFVAPLSGVAHCLRWFAAPLNGVAHCLRWFAAPLNGVAHCLRWFAAPLNGVAQRRGDSATESPG